MAEAATLLNGAQDQTLKLIRQGQDAVVQGVEAWAKRVEDTLPTSYLKLGLNDLPKPVDVVDGWFDFTQSAVEAQRAFAHSLIEALSPAGRAVEEAVSTAAGTAQSAATKARQKS